MSNISNEVIGLVEKVSDQNFKGENLEVLGLTIPSSLEEVGIYGATVSLLGIAKAIRDKIFSNSFENFTNELNELTPRTENKLL